MRKFARVVAPVCLVALCACAKVEISSQDELKSTGQTETKTEAVKEITTTEAPTQTKKQANVCPVEKINFYLYKDGVRTLKQGYEGPFTEQKDIVEYQIFMTDEQELSGAYFKDVWDSYMDNYPGGREYKIGYLLDFNYKDEDGKRQNVHKFIFSPKDTESYFDYIQTWMYDDTHKAYGQWYSHVTEDEMTDEVRLTAIKFTGGDKIDSVEDDFSLTVFLYKDDKDFSDDKTEFIGNCYKTIHYTRK